MLMDRYDLPLSTGSSPARDAYVQACDRLLSVNPGAIEAFETAIAADPDFALQGAGATGRGEPEGGAGITGNGQGRNDPSIRARSEPYRIPRNARGGSRRSLVISVARSHRCVAA